ncbi:MAG TPA: OmpH family outer membrane protein [Desulfatiglandales bacterium]|nr:OmpH family outer membrane protein [Desulfatiglandales bacterium]
MKKSFLFFTVIILILFFCSIALGENSIKIATVDLQRCLQESKEGQKAFKVLKTKKEALQKELDAKQKELLELGKELEKQSMMLSMDAQEDKRKAIERKTRELEYYFKDLNEEMKNAQEKEKERIFEDLAKVIEKIGSKENYTIIMENRVGAILYCDKSIDITEEIIKAYDQTKAGSK